MGVVRFCSVTWSVKGSALDLLCLPGFDCVASEYVAAAVYAFVSAWAVSVSRVGECALVRVGVFEYADITHALTSLTPFFFCQSRRAFLKALLLCLLGGERQGSVVRPFPDHAGYCEFFVEEFFVKE